MCITADDRGDSEKSEKRLLTKNLHHDFTFRYDLILREREFFDRFNVIQSLCSTLSVMTTSIVAELYGFFEMNTTVIFIICINSILLTIAVLKSQLTWVALATAELLS